MTLAKTCHASNMMQDLVKATRVATTKAACLNRDVSIVPLLYWKKIECHLEISSSDAQQINLTWLHIVLLQILSAIFLPNVI